ncbi:major facilitator superfamily domain-containing protein [Chaetomium fimeti]|uniref:Major facilitator superfamily domain-containing protein n=1 Tax=Chaetomium fimeti TaxID=1854472 RepID=A0AAE0LNQ8_9PEZI|nr:major facilitator superfamily domain-containing protein [Chaetomium fimeti]
MSENEPASRSDNIGAQSSHLSGLALSLCIFALCIATLCVALDNTIIATAIPRITDEFHSLTDVGWYGSSFQLPFGKLYKVFNPKWVFLVALLTFEVGSVICGAAPTSMALIIGRAIAGVGSAGVFSGSLVIIAHSTPIEKRPIYTSIVGGMFGIASVVGPLLGGAFTDHVTWRWCFYINLPIGAVTAVVLLYFLRLNAGGNPLRIQSAGRFLWSLDPLGLSLFVGAITCCLIALESWGSGRIIALFVVFPLALISFVIVQWWLGENATIPPRVGLQRTIWSSSLFTFCLSSGFFILIYFLPIYFQAVTGRTALDSGIASIPLILSNVLGLILVGGLVSTFGFYIPFVYACIVCICVAAGLITTLAVDTTIGQWIGYQILYGFGVGCAYQLPQIAAQTVLPLNDVPTGLAITIFFQNFGPAVLLSAGNNVLNEGLLRYISELDLPRVNALAVSRAGALAFRELVPEEYLGAIIGAYNEALQDTFRVALIMSCLTVIGAAFMEWKSVKTAKGGGRSAIAIA